MLEVHVTIVNYNKKNSDTYMYHIKWVGIK